MKPSESRLLTPEELEKAIERGVGYEVSVRIIPDDDRAIIEAQDTKTASIKDDFYHKKLMDEFQEGYLRGVRAEGFACQQRVEGIKREIEGRLNLMRKMSEDIQDDDDKDMTMAITSDILAFLKALWKEGIE